MRKRGCITAIQDVGETNRIPFLAFFTILGGSKIKDSPAISGPVKRHSGRTVPVMTSPQAMKKGLMD